MSDGPVECEVKLRLPDAATHERLLAQLGEPAETIEQDNHFFDTPTRALSQKRWAVRLRRDRIATATRRMLTVKGPAARVGAAMHRPEWEIAVDPSAWSGEAPTRFPPALADTEPLRRLREQVAFTDPLERWMGFTNRRIHYVVFLGGCDRTLAVDRTAFSTGEIDYELELEIAAGADPHAADLAGEIAAVERDLRGLVEAAGAAYQPADSGKLARAIRYARSH